MEVRDGVYTYDLPWSFGGYSEPLSVHVIEADGTTVLFGSGTAETVDDLVENVGQHDVDVVFVEHGDVDHYGGVPRLREEWDIEVAAPAGDVALIEAESVEVDRQLEGGRSYWGIETISAPGHTPDNMSYRFEEVLVAGDTVCGSDSPFAADDAWQGAFAPLQPDLNDDDQQTLASISNLMDHEFEVVLTTHGQNALENGHGEIETLVDEIDVR